MDFSVRLQRFGSLYFGDLINSSDFVLKRIALNWSHTQKWRERERATIVHNGLSAIINYHMDRYSL